jgi:hypothetical protein
VTNDEPDWQFAVLCLDGDLCVHVVLYERNPSKESLDHLREELLEDKSLGCTEYKHLKFRVIRKNDKSI